MGMLYDKFQISILEKIHKNIITTHFNETTKFI